MSEGKDKLRKAFPVGTVSKEKMVAEQEVGTATGTGIVLARKAKVPMATLTIRYPLEFENRLENIARQAGLSKTEVTMSIFAQTFPDLESQFGIE